MRRNYILNLIEKDLLPKFVFVTNDLSIVPLQRLHLGDQCTNSLVDVQRMAVMLNEDPNLLDKPQRCNHSDKMVTPLLEAARLGHNNCVAYLIARGADVSTDYTYNTDALLHAILSNDWKTVKCVIDSGFMPISNTSCKSTMYRTKSFYVTVAICIQQTYAPVFAPNVADTNILQLLFDHGASVYDPLIDINHDLSFLSLMRDMILSWFTTDTFVNPLEKTFRQLLEIVNLCPIYPDLLKICLLNCPSLIDLNQLSLVLNYSDIERDRLSFVHHWSALPIVNPVQAKESLNVLYHLGCNLWQKNRLGLTAIDVRIQFDVWAQEIRIHHPEHSNFNVFYSEDFIELTEHMKKLMSEPLSLMSCCRVSLLRHLKERYMNCVNRLPLPNYLISFLQGSDLTVTKKLPNILRV